MHAGEKAQWPKIHARSQRNKQNRKVLLEQHQAGTKYQRKIWTEKILIHKLYLRNQRNSLPGKNTLTVAILIQSPATL